MKFGFILTILTLTATFGIAADTSKNLTVYDVRIRSIDENNYVKEMLIIDFDQNGLTESVGYKDYYFVDNGEGNDKVAGDGVYTTTTTFKHDNQTPFEKVGTSKSILEKPILNTGFDKVTQITAFGKTYKFRDDTWMADAGPEWIFNFSCDVSFGTCGCRAHSWGWCDCCCIGFSNCRTGVNF